MKEQLLNIVMGVAGQLAYRSVLQISDSEKQELLEPSNWTFAGTNTALIMLNETMYLFNYDKFFLQIQLTVKNNTVVKIDTITDETKKIAYGE